jgi:hypothetical protein
MSKDILKNLNEDIKHVEDFLSAFSEKMNQRPSDGGWTASQCMAHISDSEIALSLRLRMMLTTENYNFANFDEDDFANLKPDRNPKISFESFKSLRLGNIELASELTEEQFAIEGIRPNGERITIIDYLARMSNHVRIHLEQAVKAAKAEK